MTRKQALVAAGMAAAAAAGVGAVSLAPHAPPASVAVPEALALAVRWLTVPGLTLLAGVGAVAARRFFSAAAIDGQTPADDRFLRITLRCNRNTLEQAALAAIAWTGLAAADPAAAARLVPTLAALFAVGRASFWAGYLAAPWARAFGFALTFYPTAAVLVWLGVKLLRAG